MRIRLALFALVLLAALAQSAAAANVLFKGSLVQHRSSGPRAIGTVTSGAGLTLSVNTTGTSRSFSVPSKAFESKGAIVPTFIGSPFIPGYFTRSNYAATSFKSNVLIPNNTYKFTATSDAQTTPSGLQKYYPALPSTPPTPAWMRWKAGPNGFGGRMPVHRHTTYLGTFISATKVFDFRFDHNVVLGSAPSNPYWGRTFGGYSSAMGVTTPTVERAVVIKLFRGIWATGTVTTSNPFPPARYDIKQGFDARTAAGATGTIQLVMPSLVYGYEIEEVPPPLDGTGTVTSFAYDGGSIYQLTLQLPEPARLLLLGAGVLSLAALGWMRRPRG